MSSFDFTNYLTPHLRAHTESGGRFSVETLTGGLTNHTARISFSPPLSVSAIAIQGETGAAPTSAGLNPTLPRLASVVLKHAPPHLAADPTRPMSVDRQLVEKQAFEVLAGADPAFPGLQLPSPVRVPRLVWHDAPAHVLWIEDLGRLTTLSEVLLAPAPAAEAGEEAGRLHAVAADLGAFLAALFHATAEPPASVAAYIARVSDRSGIYDYLADVVLTYLRGAGIEDAGVLSERVRTGFDASDDAEPRKCLGMVDFWPENVLVEVSASGAEDEEAGRTSCGLVDWEYFGVSDASSELGMFLAHLHVHMLNAATSPIAKRRIQDFTRTWLRAYVETQFASTSESSQNGANVAWRPSNGFIRRLLLSHGRDLVRGVKLYSEKLDDGSKRRLLEGGARSLRAAGESSDKIDVSYLRPSAGTDGDEADLTDIWEGLSILVSV